MRQVLVIAWYDLKRVLGERVALFWIFVGPLIFTVVFGFLFQPSPVERPRLAIGKQFFGPVKARRIWRLR